MASNVACAGVLEGGDDASVAVNSLTFAYPGLVEPSSSPSL